MVDEKKSDKKSNSFIQRTADELFKSIKASVKKYWFAGILN